MNRKTRFFDNYKCLVNIKGIVQRKQHGEFEKQRINKRETGGSFLVTHAKGGPMRLSQFLRYMSIFNRYITDSSPDTRAFWDESPLQSFCVRP